jgi:uncharacterized lipoprotein YbaY
MRRFLTVTSLVLLAACSSPSPYQNAELSGAASYRQSIVYGPHSTLIVYLIDASGPESALEVDLQKLNNPAPGTELLAATTIEGMIRSPTSYSLAVPLDHVDEGHDYRLKAVILDQGKPVMATENAPLVLTKGRPLQAELMLSPVSGY